MCTAADMPGLLHILMIALLASCDAFRLGSSQHNIPFSPEDEGPVQPHFIQELVRVKRHAVQELVLAQPHLVHDIGRPEIHEPSRSQARREAANSSQLNSPQSSASQEIARPRATVDGNVDVVDEMERMVHLTVPEGVDSYPETELLSGPGAGDTSLEASGFYGTDAEDRDRGEEGGDDRERIGEEERGEDEWERDGEEDRERRGGDMREEEREGGGTRENQRLQDVHLLDGLEVNHTTPDLDALIGYSPFFDSSKQPRFSSPAEVHDSGLQEHQASPVLEVAPSQRELWEAEGEEEGQSSGYGVIHSSITTAAATSAPSAAGGDAIGTFTPETDTGTDFALLDNYSKDDTHPEDRQRGGTHSCTLHIQRTTVPWVDMEEEAEQEGFRSKDRDEEEEEEWRQMETEGVRIRHIAPLTTDPSPTISFTDPSWDWLEKTTPLQTQRSEVRGGEVTEFFLPNSDLDDMQEPSQQVVCVDWSVLTGRGYVILNMTKNFNCEEFRADQGVRLLKIMEQVFARRMNSPEGSWVLYLSKPTHQQHQLLMNVASEHGVIATKEVLGMLGEIRKSLNKVGIQNYSSATSCQSRLSQTRSDYGKLFVVLVIIGSVCMIIITSGFIYICWQRRLPATKTTFRAEELHFVENGCHDNPTLDVTSDNHPEMQEKKPSTNGLKGGGEGGKEDSSRWQGFVNQAATVEEEEEQDTHL